MKIRAAIAGAGLMGFWHAQSIARVGGEVAAVCDVDDAAARSLANRFKSAHASTRLEDVLEQEKIDILHICTPLSSHFELAATALSRGTHVLIEKPMTPHCAETEQLYARAADNRVLLCPVHQLPFQRGVRRALAELGKIGQLRHFEAIFCSAGGAGRSREELDQIVAEILPHPLSLMQLFAPGTLSEKRCQKRQAAAGVAGDQGAQFPCRFALQQSLACQHEGNDARVFVEQPANRERTASSRHGRNNICRSFPRLLRGRAGNGFAMAKNHSSV